MVSNSNTVDVDASRRRCCGRAFWVWLFLIVSGAWLIPSAAQAAQRTHRGLE